MRGALVYQLLMQTEDGGLQRRYIEHMSTVELTDQIRREWAGMPKVRLRPGMTGAQVARLEKDERTIQKVSDTRIFIDILEELRWMLLNPAIETSGRVLLQCSGLAVIRWRGIAQISKQFRVPTICCSTLPCPKFRSCGCSIRKRKSSPMSVSNCPNPCKSASCLVRRHRLENRRRDFPPERSQRASAGGPAVYTQTLAGNWQAEVTGHLPARCRNVARG